MCFLSTLDFTDILSMPSFPSLSKLIFRIAVLFHLICMNKDSGLGQIPITFFID